MHRGPGILFWGDKDMKKVCCNWRGKEIQSIPILRFMLALALAGVLLLQGARFMSNEAAESGGALSIVKSLTSGAIALTDGQLIDNRARRGGAIFCQGAAELDLRSSSSSEPLLFQNNLANAGGAMYIILKGQTRNILKVGEALFSENRAIKTERNDRRMLLGNEPDVMGDDGTVLESMGRRSLHQAPNNFLRYIATGNGEIGVCGEGGGSAVCLDLSTEPLEFDVDVEFFKANFTGNEAGGKGRQALLF